VILDTIFSNALHLLLKFNVLLVIMLLFINHNDNNLLTNVSKVYINKCNINKNKNHF